MSPTTTKQRTTTHFDETILHGQVKTTPHTLSEKFGLDWLRIGGGRLPSLASELFDLEGPNWEILGILANYLFRILFDFVVIIGCDLENQKKKLDLLVRQSEGFWWGD